VGLSCIILSRELFLDEIKEIRQEYPDNEFELFAEGLCLFWTQFIIDLV